MRRSVSPTTPEPTAPTWRAVDALRAELGPDVVAARPEERLVYEYDYGLDRGAPDVVVIPRNHEQVASGVALAARHGLAVVPRGAGTGIAGGAVPTRGGLLISFARMRAIGPAWYDDRAIVVEPGAVNLDVTRAVERDGYFFAPDPSSQRASTIGGNIGNNAGGPHCLALGVMVNHVLGLTLVLDDGESVELGGLAPDRPGYDLTGFVVGAEGTVGVVTSATLRLTRAPEAVRTFLAVFDTVDQASTSVSAIVGAGMVPAALELMDRLALQAIEAAFHAGYPPEAGAVLLVEIDGLAQELEPQTEIVERICRQNGALRFQVATTAEERARLWAARKGAASAMGRVAPNYYLHDAVVARTRLPEVLARVIAIGERYGLPVANLFHAGDGNLHPMILFDVREPGIMERVMAAGHEMLKTCVEAGGTLSGEHGIGVEKNEFMPWIFSEHDLAVMDRARSAFDPAGRFNPGKVLPSGAKCGDVPRAARGMPKNPELWV